MNISIQHKKTLYLVTFLIDLYLITILFTQTDLTSHDHSLVLLILFFHSIFYYSLTYNHKPLITILHVLVYVCLSLGFFATNVLLISLFLASSILIQLQWFVLDKCIMMQTNERFQFGYNITLQLLNILYIFLMSYKLYMSIR